MAKSVAFLRAINLGGRFVKMEDLRRIITDAGFNQVETFIQSGNLLFASPPEPTGVVEERIEAALLAALGYRVDTFIRSAGQLIGLAERQPFLAAPPQEDPVVYVAFVRQPPGSDVRQRLEALANPVDSFLVDGNHIFWLRRRALGESPFSNARLEKALAVPATIRNLTTIRKLGALLAA